MVSKYNHIFPFDAALLFANTFWISFSFCLIGHPPVLWINKLTNPPNKQINKQTIRSIGWTSSEPRGKRSTAWIRRTKNAKRTNNLPYIYPRWIREARESRSWRESFTNRGGKIHGRASGVASASRRLEIERFRSTRCSMKRPAIGRWWTRSLPTSSVITELGMDH